MLPERRREIFEKILANAERLNVKFEDDPAFRASVEEWIRGEIDADQLRELYSNLVKSRRNARKLGFALKPASHDAGNPNSEIAVPPPEEE